MVGYLCAREHGGLEPIQTSATSASAPRAATPLTIAATQIWVPGVRSAASNAETPLPRPAARTRGLKALRKCLWAATCLRRPSLRLLKQVPDSFLINVGQSEQISYLIVGIGQELALGIFIPVMQLPCQRTLPFPRRDGI